MRPYAELTGLELRIGADLPGAMVLAADAVAAAAAAALSRAGRFTVALSGGATPKFLFDSLATTYREALDWSRVFVIWGDERPVGPDHPDSNYGMAQTHLLARVPVPAAQVFRIRGELAPQAAAAEYAETLRRVFQPGPLGWPHCDLVLLGVGEDGHTASLFPGTDGLRCTRAAVVSNFVPRLGTDRLTLTFPAINAADLVLVLACGAAKAGIVRTVLREPPVMERYPMQGVNPASGKLRWIVDEAAAAQLPPSLARRTGGAP